MNEKKVSRMGKGTVRESEPKWRKQTKHCYMTEREYKLAEKVNFGGMLQAAAQKEIGAIAGGYRKESAFVVKDAGERRTRVFDYRTDEKTELRIKAIAKYYGESNSAVIRHLLYSFEAGEYDDKEPEVEVQQMPLPEPEREPEEVPVAMVIETMKDDATFRWTLTEYLRQIALALIAVNENLDTIAAGSNATIERQGAVMAELGKITGQLKTLNNAVWNR